MKKLVLLVSLLFTLHARADVLFEGWYQIISAGQHAGYIVQRYEVDPKTKIFTSTYFLKTNAFGNEVTEGVKAQSAENLTPIAYQYTSKIGKKTKVIDAVFQGGTLPTKPGKKAKKGAVPAVAPDGLRMIATVIDDGKAQKIEKNLPKGTFLSTFLIYLMLQNKDGIKVGNNYEYNAIAEEDAEVYKGTSFIKETAQYNGNEVYKILNTFKDIQFINYVTNKGEVVFTKTPVLHLQSELTTSAADARKTVSLDDKSLRVLFGGIPGAGSLASSSLAKGGTPMDQPAKTDDSTKGAGVPAGKGIVTKPGTSPTSGSTTE